MGDGVYVVRVEPDGRIISVSRRTDVPAFYGDWFMGRVREGFAGVVHPFGGKRYLVSLKPENVTCFVFWSKDFTPFVGHLETLDRLGYRFYFNYTVTAVPSVFESDVDRQAALETLKYLSRRYSPEAHQLAVRSHRAVEPGRRGILPERVRQARPRAGGARRAVLLQLRDALSQGRSQLPRAGAGPGAYESSTPLKTRRIELAGRLASIAQSHGIRLYSCCGESLVGDTIRKAHCIDGSLIEQLFYPQGLAWNEKPTRPGCGCTESLDIGAYDTCPHGCVYCYANANKTVARRAFDQHDPSAAFLGFTKSQSDSWLAELKRESLLPE